MGIQIARQTEIFLYSCVIGFALGVLYDVFRILRLAIPSPRAVILVQDILFFSFCALLTFFFMLSTNEGQVRFFILIGELLGAIVQHLTLGVLTMRVSKAIITLVKKILHFLFSVLIAPVLRLIAVLLNLILIKPVRFLMGRAKKVAGKAKYRLKRRRLLLYNQIIYKAKAVRKKIRGNGEHSENQ